MAAQGVRPYQNDNAKDWFWTTLSPVADEIDEVLARAITQDNYDAYRAVAWLLIKIGRDGVYPTARLTTHLSDIHDRLQDIKDDNGYLATWQSPTEFVKDLDDLIVQLQRVCKWNNVTVTF